ncbi:trypsin-like serine peptidase [Mycobacterium branderi]|uniref:Trypsin n=1 Tax=Mycobacterium branderi TaxID=43348 RepID=A0AA91LVY7_9MYCO|nr:trypsin-like peptidase domain-containing protein [Mycobacterium branderi]MCV7232314.1 trypsin-like peptidase domain-containing protein [Mycobacterium branderi]ORA36104.1 trypsin [Mycobacterium branderi]
MRRVVAGLSVLAVLLAACGQRAASAPITATSEHAVVNGIAAGPVPPDPRVGAIFLGGGDLHTCTGSVLHSAGGDLVLTAAHCLAAGLPTNFVPGFSGSAPPAEVWTVDTVYLDPRWLATQDPRADYAIARVSRPDGAAVEARAGSALSLGSAPGPGTRVSVVGYPVGAGGAPIGCRAETALTQGTYPTLPCAGLVDGTSGAPWISGSTVTGVIGGLDGGGCEENVSYSAPFDEQTTALLDRAEAGGPGDVAPQAFNDPC